MPIQSAQSSERTEARIMVGRQGRLNISDRLCVVGRLPGSGFSGGRGAGAGLPPWLSGAAAGPATQTGDAPLDWFADGDHDPSGLSILLLVSSRQAGTLQA